MVPVSCAASFSSSDSSRYVASQFRKSQRVVLIITSVHFFWIAVFASIATPFAVGTAAEVVLCENLPLSTPPSPSPQTMPFDTHDSAIMLAHIFPFSVRFDMVQYFLHQPTTGSAYRRFDEKLAHGDRKSTRLNSSHLVISYAVFCL